MFKVNVRGRSNSHRELSRITSISVYQFSERRSASNRKLEIRPCSSEFRRNPTYYHSFRYHIPAKRWLPPETHQQRRKLTTEVRLQWPPPPRQWVRTSATYYVTTRTLQQLSAANSIRRRALARQLLAREVVFRSLLMLLFRFFWMGFIVCCGGSMDGRIVEEDDYVED